MDAASVHGAIASLSPIKKRRTSVYSDGTFSEEGTEIRFVGFNSEQQKKLKTFFTEKQSINIKNCQIKEVREGHKMEVMLKSIPKFLASDKAVDVPTVASDLSTTTTINLSELTTTPNF